MKNHIDMRMRQAPPGMETSVGVGHGARTSPRCRATHDVPYTLRCVLSAYHPLTEPHRDKEGKTWTT